jgi:acyl carrier protein
LVDTILVEEETWARAMVRRARDAFPYQLGSIRGVTVMPSRIAELRDIVADVLELDSVNIIDTADFVEKYGADSLGVIEIMSRIEMKYNIEIPQSELPDMLTLQAFYAVVARCAGWPD